MSRLVPVSAALALVALVAFPLVVLVLAAGMTVAAVSLSGDVPVVPQVLGWGAVALVVALVGAVVAAVRARPAPAAGPELTRADHPALWAEVDAVAAAAGTSSPDRVVVDLQVNASVAEVAGWREVVVGLPLLVGLRRDELRSVLAHEVGHVLGGDTAATGVRRAAFRASALLGSALDEVGTPVRLLLLPYVLTYEALAHVATREQELRADELAATVAGPDVVAAALRRAPALVMAWEHYCESYLGLGVPARRRPRLAEGFAALLREDAPALEEAVADEVAREGRGSLLSIGALLDSHPSTSSRVEHLRRLDVPIPHAGPGDDEAALSLLGGGEAALADLEARLLEGTPLRGEDPLASWDEVVDAAWRVEVADVHADLVRAGQRTGLAPGGSPAELLDAVAAGHGLRLVGAVQRGLSEEDRWQALHELLAGLAGSVLATAGRARAEVCWTGPWRVRALAADGTPGAELDLEALVVPVLEDPARGAAALSRTLVGLGGELSSTVPSLTTSSEAAGGVPDLRLDVAGVVVAMSPARGVRRDVVVAREGLLLVPSAPLPWWSRLLEPVAARRCRARAEELALGEPATLLAEGGRWLPVEQVRYASTHIRPWGFTLRLDLADGERLSLRTTGRTEEVGDAVEQLGLLAATHPRRLDDAPDHRAGDVRVEREGDVPEPV
ncbi:M48 family metallopeptidase [Pseudokineococcus sp. 1T1Z-3]|uniref:M48 family metallopeptidase n=1 Tax=Pseudokineococcus sp. 1T1Z-3 TaxID=3132745 RepID=UPI0030AF553E